MIARLTIALLAIAGITLWTSEAPIAHRTVVSPYAFHTDVQPILARRCTSCHVAGGMAPTSLGSFQEVREQSWPLRQTLMARRMPPWFGDSGAATLREQQSLTAREIDILMTWAAGGMPEGAPGAAIASTPSAAPTIEASDAASQVTVPMPAPFALEAGITTVDHEVALPPAALRGRWIRAISVLPGAPAIVRHAEVMVRARNGEQSLGPWIPGDAPQPFPGNGGVFVPREATLVLRLRYQRAGASDSSARVVDRSAVTFHLAPEARAVRSIEVSESTAPWSKETHVVALRPVDGPDGATVRVDLVSAGGRTTLLRYVQRPAWPRRYVFDAPVTISPGSRIELRVTHSAVNIWRSLLPEPIKAELNARASRATVDVLD